MASFSTAFSDGVLTIVVERSAESLTPAHDHLAYQEVGVPSQRAVGNLQRQPRCRRNSSTHAPGQHLANLRVPGGSPRGTEDYRLHLLPRSSPISCATSPALVSGHRG